jgi:hypothetical protein
MSSWRFTVKVLAFVFGTLISFIILSSLSMLLINRVDESIGTLYVAVIFMLSFSFTSLKLSRLLFSWNPPREISRALYVCFSSSCLLALTYLIIRFSIGRTLISFFAPILSVAAFLKYRDLKVLKGLLGGAKIKGHVIAKGVVFKKYSIILRVYPTGRLQAVMGLISASGGRLLVKKSLTAAKVYVEFTTHHLTDLRGRARLLKKIHGLIDDRNLLTSCLLGVPSTGELNQLLAEDYRILETDDPSLMVEYDPMFDFLKPLHILRREGGSSGLASNGSLYVVEEHGGMVVARALSSPKIRLEREQLVLQLLLYSLKPPQGLLDSNRSQKG